MIITFFDSLGCSTKQECATNWQIIRQSIDNPKYYPSKKDLPLIKLAEFGQLRSDKGSLKTDDNVVYVWGLEGDYDGGQVQPQQAIAMLQHAGITASIHTSPSHREASPRWRVLAPLSHAVYPDQRKELMAKLNGALGGILATESFTLSQGFFFGAVTGSVGYKAYHSEGKCIDTIPALVPVYPLGVSDKQPTTSEFPVEVTTLLYNELRSALRSIPTDEYIERISVGQALSSLGDTGNLLWEEWLDSAGRGFKHETHSKWVTFSASRTSYQSVFSKAAARGWENPAIKKTTDPRTIKWGEKLPGELGGVAPGESIFGKYTIGDTLEELKKRATEENFIMEGIALQGQITVLYAKPNSGKTLLTLKLLFDSLAAGRIEKGNVFYINADDTLNGYIAKATIAKKYGCEMIVPSERGFEPKLLLDLMLADVANDACKGKVIILDTLKKFTDLMSKQASSQFMAVARTYITAGGSLILLAHTNKRKNESGKTMFGGTSDISDDGDCAYILEETRMAGDRRHVVFTNFKSRGNVVKEAEYSYMTGDIPNYGALVDSVKFEGVGNYGELSSNVHTKPEKVDLFVEEIKDAIEIAISQNIVIKKHLINYIKSELDGVSAHKAREVIDKFTGSNYKDGHRWNYQLANDNQTKQYFLIPPF